jgi:hypothetical protein
VAHLEVGAVVVVQKKDLQASNNHPVSGYLWLLSLFFLHAGAAPPGQEG